MLFIYLVETETWKCRSTSLSVCVLPRPGYTNPNGGNYLDTIPASRVDDIGWDWGLEAAWLYERGGSACQPAALWDQCCGATVVGATMWPPSQIPLKLLTFSNVYVNQSINQSVFIYEALHHFWTHLKFCIFLYNRRKNDSGAEKKHFCLELHWHLSQI